MGKSLVARAFLLGVLLTLASSPAMTQPASSSATATLRGRITDTQSREPVGQAEVVVVGTAVRAYTDDDGRFVLERVAPGAITLAVVRMGYVPLRRELTVAEGADLTVDLELARSAVKLEEITVTPGSFSFMGQGTGTRQTMSREDVQAVPQIGDDIFRAVNRLPGLASNDYSAHFGVRGGRHDETLIVLDGLELYEPYHLKDFNEGAVSIIHAETIEGVQLMTGGFSSRYGNKRSGVFDVTSRTPDPSRTHIDVGSSFMNTSLMMQGPFLTEKATWLAFGRIGYMGPMFQFIDKADVPKPEYEDVFAKLNYQVTPNHALALQVLHAGDRYKYDLAATTGFNDTINTQEIANTDWRNSYVWSTLKSTFGPRTSVRTLVSGSIVRRGRDGSERDVLDPIPYYSIHNTRRFTTLSAAQDWSHGFSDDNLLSFGVDFRSQENKDTYVATTYGDPNDPEAPDPGEFPVSVNERLTKKGNRLALYLSDRWRVARPLVVEAGLRFDRATWTGDEDVSPRLSAAMDLGRGMTARVGWGYYRQMQGIDDVSSLDATTPYFPSELSEQFTAGWERTGAKGSQFRIEGYYKRGSNLRPVFRNWKGAVDAFPEINEDRIKVFPDRNEGKGVEVYFDRPIGERLTMRASYSYSVADEEVKQILNVNENGSPTFDLSHPNPQDQTHAANADLTYRVGSWSVNGSFAYHSGWPATEEHLVTVPNAEPPPPQTQAAKPIKIYGARLPDYLRLDARVVRKFRTPWGEFGTSLDVINLTNNTNVHGYDYIRIQDGSGFRLEQGEETWFTIFPSLGITWSRSF